MAANIKIEPLPMDRYSPLTINVNAMDDDKVQKQLMKRQRESKQDNFHVSKINTMVDRFEKQNYSGVSITGMNFFSYLTDFSYFPMERNCQRLQDAFRTAQK
jgi:arginine utilization protein RocB